MSYSIVSPTKDKTDPVVLLELFQRLAVKGYLISKDEYEKESKSLQQAAQGIAANLLKPTQRKLLAKYEASLPRLLESVRQNEILIYDPGKKNESISVNGILVPHAWIRMRFRSDEAAGAVGSTIYSITQDLCTSEKDVWAYLLPVLRDEVKSIVECYGVMEWQAVHRMRLYDGFGQSWKL